MAGFDSWCTTSDSKVGSHDLHLLEADEARLQDAIDATAAILPDHYVSPERVAAALARLGKPRAAEVIRVKLPTTPQIRSGDLGEILATEWIVAQSEFDVPIRKLRWKDHRNMAMRGDDVLGFATDEATGRVLILKVEAKSRAALRAEVVAEAREALDRDDGRPASHALSFVAERLHEAGRHDLADVIDDALHDQGIPLGTVRHLLFVFAGKSPEAHLRTSLDAYAGLIAQRCVGLRVTSHGDFIRAVFDLMMTDADDG
jgi:hypothetical protein